MKKNIAKLLTVLLLISVFAPNLSVFAAETDINLAINLKYTVSSGEPISMSYGEYTVNGEKFEIDNGCLTDGKRASSLQNVSEWYRAYRGKTREVLFDLGSRLAISGVNASFYNSKSEKITAPRYINVYLSDDGVRFAKVSNYDTGFKISDIEPKNAEFAISFSKVYAARYVKVEYNVDEFSYCDEIEIKGRLTLNGKETKIKPASEPEPEGYLGAVSGVTNIIKLNNGYNSEGAVSSFTEESLLPYIAYISVNGEISGKMFDSAVIAPYNVVYPSGGTLYQNSGNGTVMSDWELYFDCLFNDGGDLAVLDKTVSNVYTKLGINNKFKVFLSLPYPKIIETPFGDIDLDGMDDSSKTLSERTDILKWYANKCISAFLANEYKNLSLGGFMWCADEIAFYESEDEFNLIREINRYIFQKRIEPLFSFGYLFSGFDIWTQLKAGGAFMDSGYCDPENEYDREMLSEFASSLKNNKLGVEIEIPRASDFKNDYYADACRKYENLLFYGYKTGYMSSVKLFSEDENDTSIGFFSSSDISTPRGVYLRRLYDLTYTFLRGTYKNKAPTVYVPSLELLYGEERVMAEITVEDPDSHWDDLVIEFVSKPENGNIAVSSDKQMIIFQPDKGFYGEDSFVVRVNDGFNASEELKVDIIVKNDEPSVEEIVSEPSEAIDLEETEEPPISIPPWLIIVVVVLGSAMIAVAVTVIIKSVKK